MESSGASAPTEFFILFTLISATCQGRMYLGPSAPTDFFYFDKYNSTWLDSTPTLTSPMVVYASTFKYPDEILAIFFSFTLCNNHYIHIYIYYNSLSIMS